MNPGEEDEIKIEDKKVKRYRLPDGIEFYVIDDIVEAETEGGVSLRDAGAKGKRSTKRELHALIVSDPKYPTMPYDIWQEKMRQTVLGTVGVEISVPHTDSPHTDTPHADSISVTASSYMRTGVSCKKCGSSIPIDEPRCPSCGELSPLTG